MSFAGIEDLLQQILVVVTETNVNVTSLTTNMTSLTTNTNSVLKKASDFLDAGAPIEKNVKNIEHLIFIILIVVLVMVCVIFLFWFVRHLWPLMRNLHDHEHNIDNVLQDLTTVPGYHDGSSQVIGNHYIQPKNHHTNHTKALYT